MSHRFLARSLAAWLITLLPLGWRASLVVMVSIPLSLAMGLFMLGTVGFSSTDGAATLPANVTFTKGAGKDNGTVQRRGTRVKGQGILLTNESRKLHFEFRYGRTLGDLAAI